MRLIACLFVLLVTFPAFAQESLDNLPLPRWASLAANKVHMRTGPGKRYPIDWVLRKKSLPVEITKEFENWRFVREPGGASGWVQRYMLTSARYAMVTADDQILYRQPGDTAPVVARLKKDVVLRIVSCQPQWCHAEIENLDGWVKKQILWGIYPQEIWD